MTKKKGMPATVYSVAMGEVQEREKRSYTKTGLCKKPGIYKITNTVNGNYYVGSSWNLAKRWWEHRKQLRNGTHSNIHLLNAWKKYGEASFKFEVLEMCDAGISREELFRKEQAILDANVGKPECYNMAGLAHVPYQDSNSFRPVRQLGLKDRAFIKEWPSMAEAGRMLSIAAGCIMNCCKGKLGSIGGFTWEYAEPALASQYAHHSTKHGGHNKREVVEIDSEGKVLAEFSCLAEAERITGIPYPMIIGVCSGKRNTTRGRRFRYKDVIETQQLVQTVPTHIVEFETFLASVAPFKLEQSCTWTSPELVVQLHDLQNHKLPTTSSDIKSYVFFKDEWENKRAIVESMVRNGVGSTVHSVNARDTTAMQLGMQQAKVFFEENHIAGYTGCRVSFGLVDKDERVVAAISLRLPGYLQRKKSEGGMEIARFASILNTRVRGGFSKLLKHVSNWCVDNGFNKIVTYADNRFGGNTRAGAVYANSGFKTDGETDQPSFWYTDGEKRYPRLKFKAQPGKPEAVVAQENSVWRVYGSTNNRFVLDL